MDMGDHFAQYEDDGSPVDRQDILDAQPQVRDLFLKKNLVLTHPTPHSLFGLSHGAPTTGHNADVTATSAATGATTSDEPCPSPSPPWPVIPTGTESGETPRVSIARG